ncbi:MAG: phage/plasmid primase, P4 family, partial [Actinomycetota bacterium]|nr:phage/plasmid primase, P4 family [Actinomycetota bacterium]
YYGVELRRQGREFVGRCPHPAHEDRNPSFYVGPERAVCICRSREGCVSGDVIALVARVEGVGNGEAARLIAEREGIGAEPGSRDSGGAPGRVIPSRRASADEPKPKKPESRKRKVAEVVDEVRDATGNLVAEHVRTEYVDEDGKRSKKCFWRRDGHWGLGDLALEDLPLFGAHLVPGWPQSEQVVVVEGEKPTKALLAVGFRAVGTATGASKSPSAESLGVLRGRPVVFWLDEDEDDGGRRHADAVCGRLRNIASKVRVYSYPVGGVKGADAADHPAVISGGREALEGLRQALAEAPVWEPPPEPAPDVPVGSRSGAGFGSGGGGAQSSADVPHRTDAGNAKRLMALHGSKIRRVEKWRKYLVWTGTRWEIDGTCQVERWAKDVPQAIIEEMRYITDKEERREHASFSFRTESHARVVAMIASFRSEPGVTVKATEFNKDPMLLNVQNGTLDLRTGELRPHDPDDLITQMAATEYDPSAACPEWDRFIEEILPSDELRAFFKRLVGYSLTGRVKEHILPILYGIGANGKSTVLNVLLAMMGDYGIQAVDDLLVAKGDAHSTERADLFGKRLVVCVETEEGRRLNEALVKRLTGGEDVRARRMREDNWQFVASHTILMATNHKPRVLGTDRGIWRRLRLLPFDVSFAEEDQDKDLPEKLEKELPGILRWSVEGCLEWQRDGLGRPDEVAKATEGYRGEMDVLATFLEERCVLIPDAVTGATRLYKEYQSWAEESGEKAWPQKLFGGKLEDRLKERYPGRKEHRRTTTSGSNKGRKEYLGIGLLSADDEPDTPLSRARADDGGGRNPSGEPDEGENGAATLYRVDDRGDAACRRNPAQVTQIRPPGAGSGRPSRPSAGVGSENPLDVNSKADHGLQGLLGLPEDEADETPAVEPSNPCTHDSAGIDSLIERARELKEQARRDCEGRS